MSILKTRPVVVHKHTPGEWNVEEIEVIQCPSYFKVLSNDLEIAATDSEANAKLIAAAPKLLQVAEMYFDYMQSKGEVFSIPFEITSEILNELNPEE